MNNQKINPVYMLAIAILGCDAHAQQLSVEFRTVFAAISSEKVLRSSFSNVMAQLKGLCIERHGDDADLARSGNVSCINVTDVSEFRMTGTRTPALTMVQSSFRGTGKCVYMKTALINTFGTPTTAKGRCNSQWRLKSGGGKPARIISIEEDPKNDIVYFAFEEEQGP